MFCSFPFLKLNSRWHEGLWMTVNDVHKSVNRLGSYPQKANKGDKINIYLSTFIRLLINNL